MSICFGHIIRIRLVFDSDLNRSTLPYPENKMRTGIREREIELFFISLKYL